MALTIRPVGSLASPEAIAAAVTSTGLDATAAEVARDEAEAAAAAAQGIGAKVLARDPETLMVGAITRNASGAATAAGIVWPDGVSGTYTGTPSVSFPSAIDSYVLTKGSATYTQPTVTRDASGLMITRPAIVEA